ncbi:MAG: hypothetical protein ACR2JK_01135 [Geodermatophilaceae bacterium]
MLQQTARAAPAAGRGTYRTTRWFLRAGFGVMAGLAVAQPVLAGSYLSGNLDAISVHTAIGGTLPVVGFLALILAVLHWWPGRGPAWPALVMVVLTVLIVVQANAGYSRTLGLHVPLGVAIVGTTVGLFGWSVFGRDLRRSVPAPVAAPDAPAATP